MEKIQPISPTLDVVNPAENLQLRNIPESRTQSSFLGVASLVASAIGAIVGGISSYKNRKAAKEANDLSWERTLELQKYQNEYNSPIEQMRRLKEAGLNPNLVYGNGGSTIAASSDSYKAEAQHYDPSYIQNAVNSLLSIAQFREQQKNDAATRTYYEALARKTSVDADVKEATAEDAITQSGIKTAIMKQNKILAELNNAYEENAQPEKIRILRAQAAIAELNVTYQYGKNEMQAIDLQNYDEKARAELARLNLSNASGRVALEKAKFDLQFVQDVRDFNYRILQEKANLSESQVIKLDQEIRNLADRGASSDEIINLINSEVEDPQVRQYVKAAYFLFGQACGFGIRAKNASRPGTVVHKYGDTHIENF